MRRHEHVCSDGGSDRRMFPVVKVLMEGLDADAMYHVDLEFVQIGCNRWKYMNGDWVTGGKAEPPPTYNLYSHPEAPNYGRHWMKEEISFSKVKLTNKPSPQKGQVSVRPRPSPTCRSRSRSRSPSVHFPARDSHVASPSHDPDPSLASCCFFPAPSLHSSCAVCRALRGQILLLPGSRSSRAL